MSQPPITITINKTPSEQSGLFLYTDEENRIIVNSIFSGVFENTELKPLMEIVSVNGISCDGMNDDFVKSLIDDADGKVTVVAREVVYNAYVTNTSSISTATPQEGQHQHQGPTPSAPVMVASYQEPQQYSNPPPNVPAQTIHQQNNHNHNHNVTTSTSHAPQGCIDGGQWKQIRYSGNNTFMLCLVLAFCFGIFSCCGACAYLCPQDLKDVYVVQGKVSYCTDSTILFTKKLQYY